MLKYDIEKRKAAPKEMETGKEKIFTAIRLDYLYLESLKNVSFANE